MLEEDFSSQNDSRQRISVRSIINTSRQPKVSRIELSDSRKIELLTEIVDREGMYEGCEYTYEKITALKEQSEVRKAELNAYAFLSRAVHSKFNLRMKLIKRGYSKPAVRRVLARLEDLGYIDDSQYADEWLRQRLSRHPEGRFALIAGLLHRGISRETAESAVYRIVGDEDEMANARRVVEKMKGKSLSAQRIALHNRGFPYMVIEKTLPFADDNLGD